MIRVGKERLIQDRERLLATLRDAKSGKLPHLTNGDIAIIEMRIAFLDGQIGKTPDA